MIIAHHYYVHGNVQPNTNITPNNILLQTFCFGGKIAVDVFVLISGYYLSAKTFSLKKFVKIVLQIKFYDISILLLGICLNSSLVTNKFIFLSLFPFSSVNWFASVYIVLFALVPILNFVLDKLEKSILLKGILTGIVLWFILPSLLYYQFQSNELVVFVVLYLMGGYMRFYCNINNKTVKSWGKKILLISLVMIYASILLIDIVGNIMNFNKGIFYYTGYQSILALFMAVGLFLVFKNIKISDSRIINMVASSVFGIYLIHDNPIISKIVWLELLNNEVFYYGSTSKLIIHFTISVVSVFVICCLIDILRLYIIDKPLMGNFSKFVDILERILKQKFNNTIYKFLKNMERFRK